MIFFVPFISIIDVPVRQHIDDGDKNTNKKDVDYSTSSALSDMYSTMSPI